jgi:hypothetical protein
MTVCDFCKVRDDREYVGHCRLMVKAEEGKYKVIEFDSCAKCRDKLMSDLRVFMSGRVKTYYDRHEDR